MSILINLTTEERLAAEKYAKEHSYSLSEAFKRALFEKIEDEYDTAVGEEAYRDYLNGDRKSTTASDFWRVLDKED